ncbi:hypothetical protein F5Y08DRAFT_312735 [Xylaria arbuscula]|nr:hypothetical protein F5Y08DRAFT_312735 [Xylaria arbuscula]
MNVLWIGLFLFICNFGLFSYSRIVVLCRGFRPVTRTQNICPPAHLPYLYLDNFNGLSYAQLLLYSAGLPWVFC